MVTLLKLSMWGFALTKGIGNNATKALPTPFDSAPPRDKRKEEEGRRGGQGEKDATEGETR